MAVRHQFSPVSISQLIVLFLVLILGECQVKAQEIPSNHPLYERSIRSFPYSMTLVNLVPTARENVYVADLSKNWKTGEEDIEDLLETLQREDQPSRKQKRYACRFKFCRIFDA